jgi:hypothetical protein
MSEEGNKPGWVFWATVAVTVVAIYTASFGPACWISSRIRVGSKTIPSLYAPLIWAWTHSGQSLTVPLHWYTSLFADENWEWILDGEEGEELKWIDLRID